MQVELSNGTFDYQRLSEVTDAIVQAANRDPSITSALTPFRADVPQLSFTLNRREAETYGVSVGDVFNALATYVGSTYVNQITKFGRTFDVYAQADAPYRMATDALKLYTVRNSSGDMVPLGTLASITPAHGPAVISLYNLYPSAAIIGSNAQWLQLRPGVEDDGADRRAHPAAGHEVSMDRALVSGKAHRRGDGARLCARDDPRLFRARGPIRELDFSRSPSSSRFRSHCSARSPLCAPPALTNNLYVQIGLVLLIALSRRMRSSSWNGPPAPRRGIVHSRRRRRGRPACAFARS